MTKTFKVSVSIQSSGYVDVEAQSAEEAEGLVTEGHISTDDVYGQEVVEFLGIEAEEIE